MFSVSNFNNICGAAYRMALCKPGFILVQQGLISELPLQISASFPYRILRIFFSDSLGVDIMLQTDRRTDMTYT
jgi:hypothetical protein